MIDMAAGQLRGVRLRPFPKMVSLLSTVCWGRMYHRFCPGDRCLLYYNQPRRFPQFIALRYVLSGRDTTLATFRGALAVLDEIARLKQVDALLCDAANARISDRLLARWGWQPHAPSRWHRNYIKRFGLRGRAAVAGRTLQ